MEIKITARELVMRGIGELVPYAITRRSMARSSD